MLAKLVKALNFSKWQGCGTRYSAPWLRSNDVYLNKKKLNSHLYIKLNVCTHPCLLRQGSLNCRTSWFLFYYIQSSHPFDFSIKIHEKWIINPNNMTSFENVHMHRKWDKRFFCSVKKKNELILLFFPFTFPSETKN